MSKLDATPPRNHKPQHSFLAMPLALTNVANWASKWQW